MLRVIAQGSYSNFLAMVLSLSPKAAHLCTLAKVQSLTAVSSWRIRILGTFSSCGTPQSTALLLVSAYILSGGGCGVLVQCLVVLGGVIRFWLSRAALGVAGFLPMLFIFSMLITLGLLYAPTKFFHEY